jgi:hypothetical protein
VGLSCDDEVARGMTVPSSRTMARLEGMIDGGQDWGVVCVRCEQWHGLGSEVGQTAANFGRHRQRQVRLGWRCAGVVW